MKTIIDGYASEFCSQPQGSSDYWKDTVFVRGENDQTFLPLSFLKKKENKEIKDLQAEGY